MTISLAACLGELTEAEVRGRDTVKSRERMAALVFRGAEALGIPPGAERVAGLPRVTLRRHHAAIIVGRMAKACEALDHLETYPSREVLEDCIRQLMGSIA